MAEKIYTVVNTDSMQGTTDGTQLFSARYHADGKEAAIENGSIVALEGLIEGETEIFKAVAPTADAKAEKLYLVATPELMYEDNKRNLTDFTNKAGATLRLYGLVTRNIFGVTETGFTTKPAVGDGVSVSGVKLAKAGTKEAAIGTVIEKRKTISGTFYYIMVA